MDREEFQQHVFADPRLAEPIRRAASKGQPRQFGLITEAAVVALMFPLVRYVLVHVGLPWLDAGKRSLPDCLDRGRPDMRISREDRQVELNGRGCDAPVG